MFKCAVKRRKLAFSPMEGVARPRPLVSDADADADAPGKVRERVMSRAQVDKFLRVIEAARLGQFDAFDERDRRARKGQHKLTAKGRPDKPETPGMLVKMASLISLAIQVGCRPGELLGLQWKDVDEAARLLRIRRTIFWRKGGDWGVKAPKTKLSRRNLPLTDSLLALLKTVRKRQMEEQMRARAQWEDHGFIFTDSLGVPVPQ